MELTKEHISAAEADINALAVIAPSYWEDSRYKILKKFCEGAKKILSVGCGPREPIIINATAACDITPLSYEHLKKLGWVGRFFISPCDDIPAYTKEFDVAVCSEVIEHLPTIQDIIYTFKEINRVSKKWIITTPNSAICNPRFQNFSHQQFFTLEKIKDLIHKYLLFPCRIYTKDKHIFIESLE